MAHGLPTAEPNILVRAPAEEGGSSGLDGVSKDEGAMRVATVNIRTREAKEAIEARGDPCRVVAVSKNSDGLGATLFRRLGRNFVHAAWAQPCSGGLGATLFRRLGRNLVHAAWAQPCSGGSRAQPCSLI